MFERRGKMERKSVNFLKNHSCDQIPEKKRKEKRNLKEELCILAH